MMFMGLFSLVVLPLFIIVSAQMIAHGEHKDMFVSKVGVVVLYAFAIINIASGLWLITKS